METLLPQISISAERLRETGLSTFQGAYQEVWLEVGFGGGEHLAFQAAQNPHVLCIGAEPFLNGVAKLVSQVEEAKLDNVRILHGDVRPLIEELPDQSLNRLFVLHPDPWPKKKHFKRRIVSPFLLQHAARLLKSGSFFRVASDIPDYIRWTLMQVQKHNRDVARDFYWLAEQKTDWTDRKADWPQTRYEAKAIREGRTPTYLEFVRL